MLTDLINTIEAHLAWRNAQDQKLAETTFGMKAVRDSKLMARLRGGSSINVKTMQAIHDFIAEDRRAVEAAKAQASAA